MFEYSKFPISEQKRFVRNIVLIEFFPNYDNTEIGFKIKYRYSCYFTYRYMQSMFPSSFAIFSTWSKSNVPVEVLFTL